MSNYEPLLDAIASHPTEVADLRYMLSLAGDAYEVRASFGHLLFDAFEVFHPEEKARLGPVLEPFLSESSFRKIPMSTATAFTVLAGSACFPEASLVDAGNKILEYAIVNNADFPLLKTLVNACGGSWDDFLTDHSHWEDILWSVRSRNVERRPHQATFHVDAAVAIYTNQGFWQGMMKLFGVEGGQHSILDHSETGMKIQLTWD